jgi:hypothetical protein
VKKLIPLFVITLITAISWSSCAQNKIANVTTIETFSYPIAEYSLLSPILTEIDTNDTLHFPQVQVVKEHNRFFELSIIFNEKLQQLLAKLTRSNNDKSNLVNYIAPTYSEDQSAVEACKKNT